VKKYVQGGVEQPKYAGNPDVAGPQRVNLSTTTLSNRPRPGPEKRMSKELPRFVVLFEQNCLTRRSFWDLDWSSGWRRYNPLLQKWNHRGFPVFLVGPFPSLQGFRGHLPIYIESLSANRTLITPSDGLQRVCVA